jgi:hypothetical protein
MSRVGALEGEHTMNKAIPEYGGAYTTADGWKSYKG